MWRNSFCTGVGTVCGHRLRRRGQDRRGRDRSQLATSDQGGHRLESVRRRAFRAIATPPVMPTTLAAAVAAAGGGSNIYKHERPVRTQVRLSVHRHAAAMRATGRQKLKHIQNVVSDICRGEAEVRPRHGHSTHMHMRIGVHRYAVWRSVPAEN